MFERHPGAAGIGDNNGIAVCHLLNVPTHHCADMLKEGRILCRQLLLAIIVVGMSVRLGSVMHASGQSWKHGDLMLVNCAELSVICNSC